MDIDGGQWKVNFDLIRVGGNPVEVGGGRWKREKCPLQESNLQLALRRGSLYPFN